ncbi:MAG: hypothetical protein ABIN89_20050 [Chitinophagaceae bacterium]
MEPYTSELEVLRNRIPRRHSPDNVKEMNNITDEYEQILRNVEAIDAEYEKHTANLFADLDPIRAKIKMSTSNKASKKMKDQLFDEASGSLKDSLQNLLEILV